LRRVQREQPAGPYIFISERGGPIAPKSFHTLILRLGERAGMAFPIHPHMLRWPMRGMTRGLFGWGTKTSSTL
jgi:site-specific recombinase XerD